MIAAVPVDPARARVYEHGWQSWSPAGWYPAAAGSPRPARPLWQTMAFRPERPAPAAGFQGEGLLAVDPGTGAPVEIFCAPDPRREVASIRARLEGERMVIDADEAVRQDAAGDGDGALAGWAERLGAASDARVGQALGPAWCSWYCYWREVTARDVLRNLDAIDRLELSVAIVQVDDGWQVGLGDWEPDARRFGDLADLAARIRAGGRRAGIWLAPFLVGASSATAARHPAWLVRGADAGYNWEQRLHVLDVTQPEAAEHLSGSLRRLCELGFDYFKIDFLYAGAQEGGRHADAGGLDAYRLGMELIREAVGPAATLLGCGAPLLPSVGLVDAMRTSPDIAPHHEPPDGDVSQPSGRGARLAGAARAFQHARLWTCDPDCLLARPAVERRAEWAEHLRAVGGLMCSSDPLDELDAWGLATTRELLRPASPEPVA